MAGILFSLVPLRLPTATRRRSPGALRLEVGIFGCPVVSELLAGCKALIRTLNNVDPTCKLPGPKTMAVAVASVASKLLGLHTVSFHQLIVRKISWKPKKLKRGNKIPKSPKIKRKTPRTVGYWPTRYCSRGLNNCQYYGPIFLLIWLQYRVSQLCLQVVAHVIVQSRFVVRPCRAQAPRKPSEPPRASPGACRSRRDALMAFKGPYG